MSAPAFPPTGTKPASVHVWRTYPFSTQTAPRSGFYAVRLATAFVPSGALFPEQMR